MKDFISLLFPDCMQKMFIRLADAMASFAKTCGISTSSSSEDASPASGPGTLEVEGAAAAAGGAVRSSVMTSSSTVK